MSPRPGIGDILRHIRPTRRDVVRGALTFAASGACAPAGLAQQRTLLNDASRLNPTPVAKHWSVRMGEKEEFIAGLRSELAQAAASHRHLAVGVARHSMGGQSRSPLLDQSTAGSRESFTRAVPGSSGQPS